MFVFVLGGRNRVVADEWDIYKQVAKADGLGSPTLNAGCGRTVAGLDERHFCSNVSMRIRFEWDPAKAASNLRKHGVRFETAMRVFADPFALMTRDRIEGGELRWQALGRVDGHVVLLVAHTVEEGSDAIDIVRIISARAADRNERRRYEEENR